MAAASVRRACAEVRTFLTEQVRFTYLRSYCCWAHFAYFLFSFWRTHCLFTTSFSGYLFIAFWVVCCVGCTRRYKRFPCWLFHFTISGRPFMQDVWRLPKFSFFLATHLFYYSLCIDIDNVEKMSTSSPKIIMKWGGAGGDAPWHTQFPSVSSSLISDFDDVTHTVCRIGALTCMHFASKFHRFGCPCSQLHSRI